MYVGVIPGIALGGLAARRIPHVCGGDPVICYFHHLLAPYSPCMWG